MARVCPDCHRIDGDKRIYLPKQKILFTGDIGVFGVTPLNGSDYVGGSIKACDKIQAMEVETIVPGHGPVGGKSELAEMRDYFVRARRKRFDSGMSAGRAAADIDPDKYKIWPDAGRIATNMARMYSEFSGIITPEQDFGAFVKAREEYTALASQRRSTAKAA
jgi:cyclase